MSQKQIRNHIDVAKAMADRVLANYDPEIDQQPGAVTVNEQRLATSVQNLCHVVDLLMGQIEILAIARNEGK